MIPNEKELNRIMDKCVDLVNDWEVDYLFDTIKYLQGQVSLFKDLYHSVSDEAAKQIDRLKEENTVIKEYNKMYLERNVELKNKLIKTKRLINNIESIQQLRKELAIQTAPNHSLLDLYRRR
jgi:FtsZ-binding cell division protein ZapB